MFIYKPSWQKSANCLLNWKNYFSTKWKLQTFIRQYHISSMYKLNQAKNNISLKFRLVSHSPYWSSRKEFRCYDNFVRFPSTLYRVWVSALWYMTLNIYWMKVILASSLDWRVSVPFLLVRIFGEIELLLSQQLLLSSVDSVEDILLITNKPSRFISLLLKFEEKI